MTGIRDFFKNSVLEELSVANINDLIVGMIFSILISLFILFVYRSTFRGVVYNHNFAVSLVVLSAISCLIISTISSNLVLSLGLIGALSLIRFRTAVKDPLDIVYLFWSITTGIACGAQRYTFALVGALFIGIVLMLLNMFNLSGASYLIVIKFDKDKDKEITDNINEILTDSKYKVKSKSVDKSKVELIYEIRIKNKEDKSSYVSDISLIDGVYDTVLVNYNGDYAE